MSGKTIAPFLAAVVALAACGGELQAGGGASSPAIAASASSNAAPVAAVAAPLSPSASPNVEIREPGFAMVAGKRVEFDGVVEGLAWPALTKALGRTERDTSPVVIQISRDVPIVNLLRAAWTLRRADVRLQSLDDKGVLYAVELKAKAHGANHPQPAAQPGPKTCHLAVFLLPSGALRIASPGGTQEIGGDRPGDSLAESLKAARAECPIRYIAFGAETNDVPWGRVFDVMIAVDRAKAAGDARYVLGEAIHAAPAPAAPPSPAPAPAAPASATPAPSAAPPTK